MKKMLLFAAITLVMTATIFAQTRVSGDTTFVTVFPVTPQHSGAREISKTLKVDKFSYPVKVFAKVVVEGLTYFKGGNADSIRPYVSWGVTGAVLLKSADGDIELARFVTAVGGKVPILLDVTDAYALLQGDITLKLFVDTWANPAYQSSMEVLYIKDNTAKSPEFVKNIHGTTYLWNKDAYTAVDPSYDLVIPGDVEKVALYYTATGHGLDTDKEKDNVIYIDNKEVFRFKPWRDDCEKWAWSNSIRLKYGTFFNDTVKFLANYGQPMANWCTGAPTYPIKIDLTNKITSGKHKLRYWIDAEPKDAEGNDTWWVVAARLSGFLKATMPNASKIDAVAPKNEDILSQNVEYPIRLDLIDNSSYLIFHASAKVEVKCSSSDVQFSTDGTTWANPVTVNVNYGSGLLWAKAAKEGNYTVTVKDINGALTAPADIKMNIHKNLARTAKADAIGKCGDTEAAEFAIDGKLNTKWCMNNKSMLPYWWVIGFPTTTTIQQFILKHAGAGGENVTQNTKSYEIWAKKGTAAWAKVAENKDNPGDVTGNVTKNFLANPVDADSVKVVVLNPGGDDAARIYEIEVYNDKTVVTGVENRVDLSVPAAYHVYENYPNPFNPTTTISFFVPEYSSVSVAVYNTLGQLVNQIFSGDVPKGTASVNWNATNASGQKVAGGVYFYNIKFEAKLAARNSVLLRRWYSYRNILGMLRVQNIKDSSFN